MITMNCVNMMGSIMSGIAVADWFAFGSIGGLMATSGETAMSGELLRGAFGSTIYDTKQVEFQSSELNVNSLSGESIREVGVFTGSPGTMFSREVFTPIAKSDNMMMKATVCFRFDP